MRAFCKHISTKEFLAYYVQPDKAKKICADSFLAVCNIGLALGLETALVIIKRPYAKIGDFGLQTQKSMATVLGHRVNWTVIAIFYWFAG